jgi:hypothetical protein
MYKVLGADLKEYGPVSAAQINQWITEHRLDANSQVRLEGVDGWKRLAEMPEFAAALAANAPDVGMPPSRPLYPPSANDVLADQVLARGVTIDPFSCLGRSWDLLLKNFWLLVGAVFVVRLLSHGTLWLISGVLDGGLFVLFLKLIRHEKAEFGDAFSGFSDLFLQLFLAGLISGLLTDLGVLCCIIPGIIFGVLWMLAIPLAADRKMDFWLAMETSRKVIWRQWWSFFLLALLGIFVKFLGTLCCFVGYYIAAPVVIGALAYAYEDLFGTSTPSASQSH